MAKSEENNGFGNLTPRARQILLLARQEAERFNHDYIGTEHLLLGILALNEGVAVSVLKSLGLNLQQLRLEVEKSCGVGGATQTAGPMPLSPRLKRVLAKSGLETWFGDRLFHLDQGSRRKPAPDIYLFALRSLGISPEEAVAVEDSPLGVQAAVAAGIRCIGFTGHNHVGEAIDQELLQAGAFVLEPDMGKVADLILKG